MAWWQAGYLAQGLRHVDYLWCKNILCLETTGLYWQSSWTSSGNQPGEEDHPRDDTGALWTHPNLWQFFQLVCSVRGAAEEEKMCCCSAQNIAMQNQWGKREKYNYIIIIIIQDYNRCKGGVDNLSKVGANMYQLYTHLFIFGFYFF